MVVALCGPNLPFGLRTGRSHRYIAASSHIHTTSELLYSVPSQIAVVVHPMTVKPDQTTPGRLCHFSWASGHSASFDWV